MNTNLPLSEKYRPTEFEDVVGVDTTRLQSLISDPQSLPNLLFVGPAGVGKTTSAKIILDKLAPIDVLKINGSDTTGVDIIRDKVFNFVVSRSTNPDKPKIVWIEEFDFMSQSAFAALRVMIEKYMKNARFICTANYTQKIPDPIQSRFSVFRFNKPSEDEMLVRLRRIASDEEIDVDESSLSVIAKNASGDIRTAVNTLQRVSSNETRKVNPFDVVADDSLAKKTYELLLSKDWNAIRYEIPKEHPDYAQLITELDALFYDSELDISVKRKIVELLANAMFEMYFSYDNNIMFAALASRIIDVLE